MNKIILIGRLTQDPELKYTQNGTAIANFTLAVNRRFKRDEADFIPIVVWNKPAENCANYLGKGSQVAVEGRMQVRSYENQEGQRRYISEVVADNVEFLSRSGSTSNTKSAPARESTDEWDKLGRDVSLGDIDMIDQINDDEEIPF